MSKILNGLILAQGKSKRLENKNKLDFHGVPMFLVNTLKCLKIFPKVYVSSDDLEILEKAQEVGAIPLLRSSDLCGDTPNILVYQNVLKKMGKCDGIIAVQANSPTIECNLIALSKKIMEMGIEEVMTCHSNFSLYGSVWALSKDRILNYKDPYDPKPEILIVCDSIDIHYRDDYIEALKWTPQS